MAEETVNIIDLDIDQGELVKKLTDLKQKITDLKDNTKELETINNALSKGNRQSSEQYKENAKQIEINTAQTKGLSTEYRQNQGTLTALTGAGKGQLGTLQQLAIRNKELRNEVKTLDLSQESGRKRLIEVNKELDKNNKFAKDNADASLKQKMNIGNYSSALSGLPGPLAGAARAVGVLNTAFKFLIANPIGLILAAIAVAIKLVADAISKNQGMLDRFKAIGDGIRASYDVVLDRINAVGRAINKLGKLNFKTIITGFKDMGKEMVEEFKAAKQLREELQKLEDQEIGDITRKAKLRQAIELKRLASKSDLITEKERLSLLDDAIKLEEELLDIELEAARERARISQEQIDLGDSTRKEIEENALIQAKVIDLETSSLQKRRSLAAERLGITRKIAKEELAIVKQLVDDTLKEYERTAGKSLLSGLSEDEAEMERFLTANNEMLDNLVADWDYAEQQKTGKLDEQIKLRNQAEVDAFNLNKEISAARLDVAQASLNALGQLFGQQTAIGKAAAIAETAINTYKSATAAYAALAGIPVVGPALGAVAAAAAVVAGLANVRKILAVKSGLPGDSGGGGVPSSAGGAGTYIGTFRQTPYAYGNGGAATQGLKDSTADAIQKGVVKALINMPRNVLVVEELTMKQKSKESVSMVATV